MYRLFNDKEKAERNLDFVRNLFDVEGEIRLDHHPADGKELFVVQMEDDVPCLTAVFFGTDEYDGSPFVRFQDGHEETDQSAPFGFAWAYWTSGSFDLFDDRDGIDPLEGPDVEGPDEDELAMTDATSRWADRQAFVKSQRAVNREARRKAGVKTARVKSIVGRPSEDKLVDLGIDSWASSALNLPRREIAASKLWAAIGACHQADKAWKAPRVKKELSKKKVTPGRLNAAEQRKLEEEANEPLFNAAESYLLGLGYRPEDVYASEYAESVLEGVYNDVPNGTLDYGINPWSEKVGIFEDLILFMNNGKIVLNGIVLSESMSPKNLEGLDASIWEGFNSVGYYCDPNWKAVHEIEAYMTPHVRLQQEHEGNHVRFMWVPGSRVGSSYTWKQIYEQHDWYDRAVFFPGNGKAPITLWERVIRKGAMYPLDRADYEVKWFE